MRRWAREGQLSSTCDFVCGTSLASRDQDEKFHNAVIDLLAAGLNNEDVLLADAGHDLDAGFALAGGWSALHKLL